MAEEEDLNKFYSDETKITVLKSPKRMIDQRTKEERDIAFLHRLIIEDKEIPEDLKKYLPEDYEQESSDK